MDAPGHRPFPVDEIIVRVYRRLLGFVGGLGLFVVAVQLLPPVGAWFLASLPVAAFGLVCLWTRRALIRPRPLTYWATVIGFAGVVTSVVITTLLRGDIFTPLITVFVWSGPLRALTLAHVRRALSGGDEPRGGLRRRLREARLRLADALRPQLRRSPVPVGAS